jgi:Zn-finger nucleic acid-binding protein
MKCPIDGATLALSERSGIEIDYCPECRGVWLDRGELDKIIDRADSAERSAQAPGWSTPAPQPDRGYANGHHGEHGAGHEGYGRRRRGGWLGELFD